MIDVFSQSELTEGSASLITICSDYPISDYVITVLALACLLETDCILYSVLKYLSTVLQEGGTTVQRTTYNFLGNNSRER